MASKYGKTVLIIKENGKKILQTAKVDSCISMAMSTKELGQMTKQKAMDFIFM